MFRPTYATLLRQLSSISEEPDPFADLDAATVSSDDVSVLSIDEPIPTTDITLIIEEASEEIQEKINASESLMKPGR